MTWGLALHMYTTARSEKELNIRRIISQFYPAIFVIISPTFPSLPHIRCNLPHNSPQYEKKSG